MLPLLFPALLAACLPPCQGWSPSPAASGQEDQEQELFLPPANSSSRSLASLEMDLDGAASKEEGSTDSPGTPAAPSQEPFSSAPTTSGQEQEQPGQEQPGQEHQQRPQPQGQPQPAEDPHCNISVQRQMLSSLLVRWSRPLGIQCDLLLFSTNSHGRAFFSAAFHRVGPPLLIEHLGLAAGGAQQDLRLCVGCSWVRSRRVGRLRGTAPQPQPQPQPPAAAAAAASSSLSYPPAAEPGQYWLQGEPLNFCCLDFSLEELKGEPGWRMNRKPIESTLVACFMTLVIIVWSVAALIWPVPIIAGFLPNGMEQRRGTAASTATAAAAK
ncbi:transmembrane protein 158 [Zonotrichia albicollis]|uniref:transmembrane protein 158 n=1 Tax=Zonotrichia albicollis TaxID=44394 RepID=UPI003D81089B